MNLELLDGEFLIRSGNGLYTPNITRTGTWYLTNLRLCFNRLSQLKVGLFGLFSYMMEGTKTIVSINLSDIHSVTKNESMLKGSGFIVKTSDSEYKASFNSEAGQWFADLTKAIRLYTDNEIRGTASSFECFPKNVEK